MYNSYLKQTNCPGGGMVDTSVLEADIARCKSSSLFWGTKQLNFKEKQMSQSRGPGIDLEQCVANMANNRYLMVLIASARAREIARQNKHSSRFEHLHTPVTALLEVETGKLTAEDISKIQ
jgi:DNA-directed RNA polymerase subunit K/omega